MTTENQEVQKTEGGEQQNVPQYTEIQLKAIEQGWIPKEEFDGDPSEFIDAPEFVRRGELFQKIEKQSKELKAVRQALDALAKHHSKVKEMEYERALKSLKDARKTAMREGETEQALALEEKIEEIQTEKQRVVAESQNVAQVDVEEDDTYTPQFEAWVSRNSWYETNRVMRKTADALGKEFHAAGHSPAEVLDLVEKEIKKEFKHKFQNTNGAKPPAVEGSTRGGGATKDSFVMSEEEARVMNKILSVTPHLTKETYIKELKAMRNRE